MKKARENQLIYLFLGLLMIPLSIYTNFHYIIQRTFPEGITTLFLGTSSLMMSYLSTHLFPKDERSKEIIGKSMTVNYFVLFGSIFVLFLLTGSFGPLNLTATQVLIVLTCIMITTIPLTMIYFAHKI